MALTDTEIMGKATHISALINVDHNKEKTIITE